MAEHKREPIEEEKRMLVKAIDNDDTDTIQQIIEHNSVDVDAFINWTTWTTIIGRWHYTALHYAVYENKINCVKLLVQLGASLIITDYNWSDKSRKIPLERAVDNNNPSIVLYFVKECNQDISELDQNYQSKIRSMIQEHGTDVPNLTIGVDYHRLLWQELNKNFGNASSTIFVMAVGQQLSSSDYDITCGHAELAAQKTFELVNHTIPCATNYSSRGSSISMMWERLLQGKGPRAGPEHQPAFEKARHALFLDYTRHKPTELYQDYLDKEIALKQKEFQIEEECRNMYGDQWKVNFDKRLQVSKEYIEFERIAEVVQPHLDAIEVWKHGPLVHNLNHMRQVLEDSARSVNDYSGYCLKYYRVSLQPANWYQWFGPLRHEEGAWTQINVDSENDDADQAALYTKLGGSVATYYSLDKHSDVKISFKVRAVQISRPWLDLSVLNNKNYKIYGEDPGSWSTGELDADNNGSFPLLSTQMIVARDITVTASTEMEQEAITDACSLFGVGSNSYETINNNSIELKGTQVIGYACTLVPKFPH